MKKFIGLDHILITLMIVAVLSVPYVINVITKKAPSVSTGEVSKKIYSVKLNQFNSKLNQSFIMLKADNIDLCSSSNSKNITNVFSNLMNAKNILPNNYLNKTAPRKFYTNENSTADLNFDSLMELNNGSIFGFKFTETNILNNSKNCMNIFVDLNGVKKPNMIGIDTHMFMVKKNSNNQTLLKPAGVENDGLTCTNNSNNFDTSLGCTYIMLTNPNALP